MSREQIQVGDRVVGIRPGKQGTVRYKGKSHCFVEWDDGTEWSVPLYILSKLPPEPEMPERVEAVIDASEAEKVGRGKFVGSQNVVPYGTLRRDVHSTDIYLTGYRDAPFELGELVRRTGLIVKILPDHDGTPVFTAHRKGFGMSGFSSHDEAEFRRWMHKQLPEGGE